MIFPSLRDPDLPALENLDQPSLSRITGAKDARLIKMRYQPGARAILHVSLGNTPAEGEGSVWFYAGTKAQSLKRRLPDARLDTASGALFQTFPQDHRMPHLAGFVSEAKGLAHRLIGGQAVGPPVLMRYRPGLSATFRWTRDDGRVFFVKQMPDGDVCAQASAIARLLAVTAGQSLTFTPVEGVIPDLGLIAYAAAEGQPLDQTIAGSNPSEARAVMDQMVRALGKLWLLPVIPARTLDCAAHLHRAKQACSMIAKMDGEAGRVAAGLVAGLQAIVVPVRQQPIHADMKLDHAFVSGSRTTLIDTESLSLGDPDYDLAMLEARLTMAALANQITAAGAEAAVEALRTFTGAYYPWFQTCARLQCARFFAQRFDPATIPLMRKVLAP